VAVRVLELTSDDASQAKDVTKLIASDPSLSAKVLKMVRCSERGRGLNVSSIDRAVIMLGFDALRSAVLSVQVFDVFDRAASPGGETRSDKAIFDRNMFWQHSLAVASVCESLAGSSGQARGINKSEAFTAGLLHDLGVLALHVLLPATFDRVCEWAETHGLSLDQACRKIIGLDTHTAGRRLAEHWRLPHALGDVLWLNGQKFDSLPDLPHRPIIALVTLADAVARSQCLAPAGHASRGDDIAELCAPLEMNVQTVNALIPTLHKEVALRCESLGMAAETAPAMLLRAISRANESLGRINAGLRQRSLQAQRQTETLGGIARFHDSAAPGGNVVTVMGKVVASAASVFGGGFFAVLYQARQSDAWEFIQFSSDGRALRSDVIQPPPGSTAMSDLADTAQVSVHVMAMLPWVSDYLSDARDMRDVQLLPLRCGWGVNAVLLHDCDIDGREQHEQLEALGRTWAAAIAAGAQHEAPSAWASNLPSRIAH
jgi:HD-like signal output (HDOD) protein